MIVMMAELCAWLAAVGMVFLLGRWLGRNASPRRFGLDAGAGWQRAEHVLEQLHALTANVSNHVSDHNDRIEQVNGDLGSEGPPNTEMVISAIARLLSANREMQNRLSEAEARLQEQARIIESQSTEIRTDALTQLMNRRSFDEQAAYQAAKNRRDGEPCTFMLLEIDGFAQLNEAYGRLTGDAVLRMVGGLLKKNMREIDFVARYGGEEFAAILPGTSVVQGWRPAERFRESVAATPFTAGRRELRITASVGLAHLQRDEEFTQALRRADRALCTARRAGGDCAYWHDGRMVQPVRFSSGEAESASLSSSDAAAEAGSMDDAEFDAPAPSGARQAGGEPPGGGSSTAALSDAPAAPDSAVWLPICDRMTFLKTISLRLNEWKRGGEGFTAAIIEIAECGQIVKEHGEQFWEGLLHKVGHSLGAAVREMDCLGRYTHASLGLLLPGIGAEGIPHLVQRLGEVFAGFAWDRHDREIRLTPQIGVTLPLREDDLPATVRRLDASIYQARLAKPGVAVVQHGDRSETAVVHAQTSGSRSRP
jgi:diguanylate cyclase (GGDEF)-like protein